MKIIGDVVTPVAEYIKTYKSYLAGLVEESKQIPIERIDAFHDATIK